MSDPIQLLIEGPGLPLPWAHLRAPAGLGGEDGVHRLPRRMLLAPLSDDRTAIEAWIEDCADATSVRIYRAAMEKFVNWAWIERRKAVSSLDGDDFEAYGLFLADPTPQELWQSGVKVSRQSGSWRPFVAGLGRGGVLTNLRIVRSLINWLSNVGYARLPFVAGERVFRDTMIHTSAMQRPSPRRRNEVALEAGDVAIVWAAVKLSKGHIRLRTELQFLLQYQGGLTSTEVARLAAHHVRIPKRGPWVVHVSGRPAELDRVILLPPVATKLQEFIREMNPCEGEPLLHASESDVSKANKRIFERAARLCDETGPEGRAAAARLLALEGSALKYAFARHAQAAGVGPEAWQIIAARTNALSGDPRQWGMAARQQLDAVSYERCLARLRPVLNLLRSPQMVCALVAAK